MKIVILTIKTPGNIFLANRLSKEFEIAGLVVLKEKPKSGGQKWEFWLGQVKRYGLVKVINKYLYLKLPATDNKLGIMEKSFFPLSRDGKEYEFQTETLEVFDINSEVVKDFILSKSPDLIAVCGSKVLKARIFNLPPKGTINIHCGITPHYRSANPVEWALYNRDLEKIGVTIHYVNEGVDTGNIIYQATIAVEKGDTVQSLYCKDILAGSELMIKAIKNISAGTIESFPLPKNVGKHYMSIDYGFLQQRKVQRVLKSL
jgi:methionyl-tRNA formyltransferase